MTVRIDPSIAVSYAVGWVIGMLVWRLIHSALTAGAERIAQQRERGKREKRHAIARESYRAYWDGKPPTYAQIVDAAIAAHHGQDVDHRFYSELLFQQLSVSGTASHLAGRISV